MIELKKSMKCKAIMLQKMVWTGYRSYFWLPKQRFYKLLSNCNGFMINYIWHSVS